MAVSHLRLKEGELDRFGKLFDGMSAYEHTSSAIGGGACSPVHSIRL